MAELGLNRQLAVITALLTKDTLAAGFYPSYLLVPLPFDQDRCLHSVEIGPPASLEFYNVSLEPFQLRVQQVREISRSGAQFTFQRNEVERRDGYFSLVARIPWQFSGAHIRPPSSRVTRIARTAELRHLRRNLYTRDCASPDDLSKKLLAFINFRSLNPSLVDLQVSRARRGNAYKRVQGQRSRPPTSL